jgi:hypothetical protein
MEANNISSKHMKKQILLLTAAFFFTFVLCGVASAADPSCDLTITTTANPIPPSQVYAGRQQNMGQHNKKTTVLPFTSNHSNLTPVMLTAELHLLPQQMSLTGQWTNSQNLTGQDIYLIDPTIRPVTA